MKKLKKLKKKKEKKIRSGSPEDIRCLLLFVICESFVLCHSVNFFLQ